jgi:drug/metabolite transporter (DMT)-like permease
MLWPLIGRCTFGFLSDLTMFMAFVYTAYSKAFCVHMMAPFFSPFIALYTINESIKVADIAGVVLCFAGMLMILQPWRSSGTNSLRNDLIGFLWALAGALVDAWLFVFCRMISGAFHYTVPLFYYLQLSSIFIPMMTLLTQETKVGKLPEYSWEFYGYIVLIFSLFYLHVLMFSASWKYNTVGTTAVLIYVAIPLTYLLDWAFIGREISVVEVMGAGLIFLTNISIVSLRLFNYIK